MTSSIRGIDDQMYLFKCDRTVQAIDDLMQELEGIRQGHLWDEIVAKNPNTTKACHKPGCKSLRMISYPSQDEKQCVKCGNTGVWKKEEGQEDYY